MKFEHFLGTDICDDVNKVRGILSKKDINDTNEFWISIETQFPFMGVLTNKTLAYVHFFDEDGSPGFRALSNCDIGLDLDATTTFYSNNRSEIIEVENECVISLDNAIKIVQEFYTTNKMPICVEWDEL